jgi:transposase, mutator family
MELTQLQISEILSNYTSSSKGFVTLQSLIMNFLMKHERDLFVANTENEQCNGFRTRR